MQEKYLLQAFIGVCVVIITLYFAPQVMGEYGVFAGYGYGETCSASAPNNLAKKESQKLKKIYLLWNEVEFSNCNTVTPDHYDLQLRDAGGKLIESYTDVSNNRKVVPSVILKSNKVYKFRVRAAASDDTLTSWSPYKAFRTLPAKPNRIGLNYVTATSAELRWKNVFHSKQLQHYKVVIFRGTKKIHSSKHRDHLNSDRTSLKITNLKPNTKYRVGIRSFYSSSIKSNYKWKTFRTLTP